MALSRPLAFLVFLWATLPLWAGSDDPNAAVRMALQSELEDFSVPGWADKPEPGPGPALERYRSRLAEVAGDPGWEPPVRTGTIGLVRPGAPSQLLGINVFEPRGRAGGTLYFVHGYMSHAANFAYTFRFFVERGWRVVTLDLPGHGLSTGPRADVDSFAEYGDAVRSWWTWAGRQDWPGPRILMAHSLGSAACLEALRRPGAPGFDRVILCAPLVRTDWYPALLLGANSLGWWLKRVPSTFGWDGYLDGYQMPVHWFQELGRWVDSLGNQRPLNLPLTIYTGDRDEVVDEGWNRAEFRRLVPRATVVVLPGRDHLFLTKKGDRTDFHERLARDLGFTPLPLPE